MSCQFDFSGRRVLVTGGGRGIGLEIVKLFVELKGDVVVFERDEKLLDELARDLPSVKGVKIDLADWEATRKATEEVLPIHHLINNAVIAEMTQFLNITEDSILRTFAVNYNAVVNVSQVMAKGLIEHDIKDGTIVTMSSVADKSTANQCSLYSSAKAAIAMLSQNMALELGQYGVRINCVRPSVVNTALIANLPTEIKESATKMAFDKQPLKRLIQPVEVARAVVYLCTPWASMVTGTSLTIDGGYGLQ